MAVAADRVEGETYDRPAIADQVGHDHDSARCHVVEADLRIAHCRGEADRALANVDDANGPVPPIRTDPRWTGRPGATATSPPRPTSPRDRARRAAATP